MNRERRRNTKASLRKEKYESIIAEKDRRIAELEAALADKNRIIELQDRLLRKI